MAQVPQSTLRYLYYDVLKVQPYRDPNRTYSDLVSTLQQYPGITVKGTKEYVYENGRPELLLYLGGVLPVSFRGTVYHFPILLWVPYSYPYDPPLIYVDPSEDIVVNPGQHVAPDGRIYHPYLAHWRDTWDRSNVVDFLSILADVFAKEPPVRSRPRQPRLQQHQNPPPPPRPPLPHEAQAPSTPQGPGAPPPPPPKEPAQADGRTQSPVQPKQGRYNAPLPLPSETRPPRPTSMYQQQQRPQAMPQPRPTSQYTPQRASSLRQSHPSQQWQQPPPHPNAQQPYQQGQQDQQQNSYQSPPPQQQHQPGPYPPQQQQYIPQAPPQPQPPKQPPPDLLDSPFDLTLPATTSANLPAPPIPRNPEKDALLSHFSATVTSTLHDLIAQNQSKLAPLQSQQSALQQSQHHLSSELSNLQALHSTLTSNISDLQTSLSKADHTIADAKARSAKGDIPPVDGMLITPHVVSTQLYNVTVEERGIEAAILALQEAFTRGRVGSEVWSKKTRELAREEFRKRWVARKVGRGMGLDGA